MRRIARVLFGWFDVGIALVLHVRGRWRLHRGDPAAAARLFEAAAARAPGSFAPLLALTRAYLRRRDLVLARRALARAREASPARFAREASAAMRAEGFDLATLAAGGGARAGAAADGERPERGTLVVTSPARVARAALPFGDCRDLDEYTRFRSMPAITSAEIASTDWDAIIDDLQDG
ncbi:MAG: hypothetical protein JNM10_06255 [Planctomycetia bacterium]|nr:hypothetical protein [Planctomycetia bacterium]